MQVSASSAAGAVVSPYTASVARAAAPVAPAKTDRVELSTGSKGGDKDGDSDGK